MCLGQQQELPWATLSPSSESQQLSVDPAWGIDGSGEISQHLPVPKGAPKELERDFSKGHGQGGMALS